VACRARQELPTGVVSPILTNLFLHYGRVIGSYVMELAEQRQPYESRGSQLWESPQVKVLRATR
jgi:hypothetical protein